MKLRFSVRPLMIAVMVLLLSLCAHGQYLVSTGIVPFGSYSGGPDSVNLGNLNIHLDIPILHKAGRGLNFNYGLSYDSSVYAIDDGAWSIMSNVGWQSGGPQILVGGALEELSQSWACTGETPNGFSGFEYVDPRGAVHSFPLTTKITVDLQGCTGNQTGTGQVTYTGFPSIATDGSGIVLNADTSDTTDVSAGLASLTVTLPGGVTANIAGGDISISTMAIDKNRNYITIPPGGYIGVCAGAASGVDLNDSCIPPLGDYTDTLDQPALTLAFTSTPSSTASSEYPNVIGISQVMSYSYLNGSGGTSEYQLHYSAYSLATSFGCAGIAEASGRYIGGDQPYAPVLLPDYLLLPDGRQYAFTYEQTPGKSGYVTGRIASITFPSGGAVSYVYGAVNCADGTPNSLTRTVNDANGHQSVWSYSRVQSGANWITTVTDPLQNQQVITFTTEIPPGGTVNNFYEINSEEYSGSSTSGTLMRTIETSYNDSWATPLPVTSRTITTMIPDASGKSAQVVENYDGFGNLTSTTAYDYGTTGDGVGAWLSKHVTDYDDLDLWEVPSSDLTYTSSTGSPSSAISYVYDSTIPIASGATQHNTSLNRGNMTSKTIYSSLNGNGTTDKSVTYNYTYYDTGEISTATDINNAVTTYSYSQCDSAFPTGTSTPVTNASGAVTATLTTSTSYDCVGGVPTSITDVNGNTTTVAYNDPFYRPTLTTDALGDTTTTTYPTTDANTSEKAELFDGGSSIADALTTFDGLGRAILTQKRQRPSSSVFDSVATTYDLLGRPSWTSLPYSATTGVIKTTGPGVTNTYDSLGRPLGTTDAGGGTVTDSYNLNDVLVTTGPAATGENAKQRSLEYNAAGQLTSVCEITSGTGSGSCAQSTAHTGYLTQYANITNFSYSSSTGISQTITSTVQQNIQAGPASTQTRTVTSDMMGRKLSEVIPETGSSYYTYDADPSGVCPGSSPGDLIKSVDNAGNVTCFTYDSMHRMLTSQVVSGTYATVTPQSHFVYDAASLNGTAMANAKGSMAEAYTCTGACTSKLTDEYFSASPVSGGYVVSQTWESTPNSDGYFLTQTTSGANGSLVALSASLGSTSIDFPSMTFGVDGEGRPTSAMDATHSLNLIGTVAYNTASAPTTVSYGNGDSDIFQYDPNTNRPTQFQYLIEADTAVTPNVAAFNQTGVLNWDPNGSLHSFAFTDGNDSTKSQTCTYTADDMNRLASASCGSAWAQTFTYDAFGNINKSGSGSYMAGYNAMTNQATSGVTAAYDANGNQTQSTNALLSWNAADQPVTVLPAVNGLGVDSPVSATYDALGRLVETSAASGTSQPAAASSGSIIISGSELAQYTGTLTVSGAEKSNAIDPQVSSETTGCGSVTATSATTGWCNDSGGGALVILKLNNGSVVGEVADYTYSYSEGSDDSTGSIASTIVSQVNAHTSSTGFTASQNNGVITVQFAGASSSSTNYVVTGGYSCASAFMSSCSFQLAYSGTMTAVYDAGSVSATINGKTASYSYSYTSTSSSIASGLASAINSADGSFLTASASGATISLESASAGDTTNWPITTSATYDNSVFSAPSFPAAGVGMAGGENSGNFTQFVYTQDGTKIAVVQGGKLVKGTIPLPGGGTAVYNASGLEFIRHKDWLGSSRLATTWTHGVYAKEAYAPFGETYNEAGTPDRSFTGQDQDTTNGIYDYLFRKYDPASGRWLSPDPSGWAAASPEDPQSLNRYAYVENNPMSLTDANGLDCVYQTGDSVSIVSGDCKSSTDSGVYVDCTGCVKAASFDSQSNLSSFTTDYGTTSIDNTYDSDGNPIKSTVTNPDGGTSTMLYQITSTTSLPDSSTVIWSGGYGMDAGGQLSSTPSYNVHGVPNTVSNGNWTLNDVRRALFTKWTAPKSLCQSLDSYSANLNSLVGAGRLGSLTLSPLIKWGATNVGSEVQVVSESANLINSWTAGHCSQ